MTLLHDTLAELAAAERARGGDPPTAEQLFALHAGTLDPATTERLRDRLAADPEWAEIYLDLVRLSTETDALSQESEGGDSEEVRAAWSRLVEAEPSLAERRPVRVGARGKTGSGRWRHLAWAATLILALGLGWFLRSGGPSAPAVLQTIAVDATLYRDARVPIGPETTHLVFQVDPGALAHSAGDHSVGNHSAGDPVAQGTAVTVVLLDAQGFQISESAQPVGPDLELRVPRSAIELGRSYELLVLLDGADYTSPLLTRVFTPVDALR